MISEETVERVLGSTDIVELVQSYFPLRRVGTDYTALCPFHSEKTPSFTVSPSRQMFYCFGCGAGGGAARFLMERESIDFPTAIRRLGERAGIPIVEEAVSAEEAAKHQQKASLLAVHQEVARWFHLNLLKKPYADHAREYLKKRALGIEIARDWQLGYAPADTRMFFEWARSKGYNTQTLIDAGLAAEREGPTGGTRITCRFRDRLMFPVCNDFGEVIAFSGRTLDPEASVAKYLNSPETSLFSKKKTLFGLHRSKRPILKQGNAVICEGQIDLITCFANGIENFVAPLGTAFTAEHARMLKRLTQEVIVCFDADAAGFKAAQRTFKALAEASVFVKAVEMPAGEDPDSFIKQYGAAAFRELLDRAEDFLDYHINHRAQGEDLNSPRVQHEVARELSDNIALIGDKLMQDAMIHGAASRLGLSHDEFRRSVFNAQKRHAKQKEREARWAENEDVFQEIFTFQDSTARLLCQMALIDSEAKQWLAAQVQDFQDIQYLPDGSVISKVALATFNPAEPHTVTAFIASQDGAMENALSQLTIKPPEGNHLRAAQDAWNGLTKGLVKRRLQEVEGRLRSGSIQTEEMVALLGEMQRLKESLDR